jgi:pimeloyl-ACP methyl ester carboxylesterase
MQPRGKPPLADASLDWRLQNAYKSLKEERRCAPVARRRLQGRARLVEACVSAAHHAGQGETAMPFYEKGDVRIRYEEAGSGFSLLVTPGGGLNSCVSNWPTAVINAMEEFTQDFRCITMDQRNANDGESSGPIPVDDPWGAFADDQLGLMDHLGIREFFFMGYCVGGPFALKLMQRAPERVVAGVLCQSVGHRPELPDHMYNGGRTNWAPALLARRPDVIMETIEAYLHNLFRVQPDFVYSVSRDFARSARPQCS